MEGILLVENNGDMEEENRTTVHSYQWLQQDTNSAIIKLEPETTTEALPGKWHLFANFAVSIYNTIVDCDSSINHI